MHATYWAVLLERSIQQDAVSSLLQVAIRAGMAGYYRLAMPYHRTDMARSIIAREFCRVAQPNDTLIMLDADHSHPSDILERLTAHDLPVVGALAFARGIPYFPCAFVRDHTGELRYLAEVGQGVQKVDAVGTGAIAIKRSVFDELDAAGFGWPHFRYEYPQQDVMPSEDMYFARTCELANIPQYCDMDLITPHLTVATIDADAWKTWLADHGNN